MRFLRRFLSSQTLPIPNDVTVINALRLDGTLLLYFPPSLQDVTASLRGHSAFSDVVSVGDSVSVRARPETFGSMEIKESAVETALFAGLRCVLSIWNGESAETIRSWLIWLRTHHRLEAALILDRSPPDQARDGSAQLETLLHASGELEGMLVLIVSADQPLGDPLSGHEAHPLYSPDAPGKDRMQKPSPEPWRAPIRFDAWYDMARHQFLSAARSVLALDPIDLLPEPPPGQPTVFEAAEALEGRYLSLEGQRAYPWALRPNRAVGFGDHICTRFDAPPDLRRWCFAPTEVGRSTTWRWRRIHGMEAVPWTGRFFRCVALRHTEEENIPQSVSRHVPKSSLIENPVLLRISDMLGATPRRIPLANLRSQKSAETDIAVVTTMKNEGPFILEWIAYHRMIGIEKFIVYTNDCNDGTDDLLRLLASKGVVEHRENPYREMKLKPQHAALAAADSEPLIAGASWVICMDVDEYINVKIGDGTISALFEAVPDANLISLTWRLFGNSDIQTFDPGPIIGQFDHCAPEMTRKPHQAWGFKTLYRNNGIFRKLGVHRPKGLVASLSSEVNWVNGSGKPMPENIYRTAWRSSLSTVGYDLVQLNHYAVRSAESFLVKRDRGRVNHVDRDQGLAYWFRMNNNAEQETSIMRMLPRLHAEMARLLSDPEIKSAHESCIAAHRAHIIRLKQTEQYSNFYAEITGERMRRLSRMHHHFGTNVFLAGPEVIPDDLVFREHPANFFFNVPPQASPTVP